MNSFHKKTRSQDFSAFGHVDKHISGLHTRHRNMMYTLVAMKHIRITAAHIRATCAVQHIMASWAWTLTFFANLSGIRFLVAKIAEVYAIHLYQRIPRWRYTLNQKDHFFLFHSFPATLTTWNSTPPSPWCSPAKQGLRNISCQESSHWPNHLEVFYVTYINNTNSQTPD